MKSTSTRFQRNNTNMKTETIILAAGCFWHVEKEFSKIPGVIETTVGYTGGKTKDPSYEKISSGKTGHAEAIKIIFNPKKISFENILSKFWTIHNPTSLNRQGPDVGTNYRSAIFYITEKQKTEAEKSKKKFQEMFDKPIVTEILKASEFYPAEEYHQRYFDKNNFSCQI